MLDIVRPLTLDDAVDELLAPIDRFNCGPAILRALRLTAECFSRQVRPQSHSSGMSPAVRAFLVESDEFTPEGFAETEERVARGELREVEHRTRLETIAASYGESEVAERLGLGIGEVRDRARAGELFSFDAAGIAVYPRWQLAEQTEDGVLPHLAHVLASLIDDWDPASVQGFMTAPKDDLIYRGEWQTPIQWLLRGESPRRIDVILEGEKWR